MSTKHIIKVLGKGCGSCIWTEQLVREVVVQSGIDAVVEKVSKTSEMVSLGVMATPALVIDGKLVHSGGIPTKEEVEGWVAALKG